MRQRVTRSLPIRSSARTQPDRLPATSYNRPILTSLAVVIAMGSTGLIIALVTGATLVFDILVLTVFSVLWVAFATALTFSPRTLDYLWYRIRQLPVMIQAVVWLLLLPIMIALWIWERTWSTPVRLTLVFSLAAWNIFMFFPRSL